MWTSCSRPLEEWDRVGKTLLCLLSYSAVYPRGLCLLLWSVHILSHVFIKHTAPTHFCPFCYEETFYKCTCEGALLGRLVFGLNRFAKGSVPTCSSTGDAHKPLAAFKEQEPISYFFQFSWLFPTTLNTLGMGEGLRWAPQARWSFLCPPVSANHGPGEGVGSQFAGQDSSKDAHEHPRSSELMK